MDEFTRAEMACVLQRSRKVSLEFVSRAEGGVTNNENCSLNDAAVRTLREFRPAIKWTMAWPAAAPGFTHNARP
jgi:hypothetical protein